MQTRNYFYLLLVFIFLLKSQNSYSQVKGISYTLSPVAEYTWWDGQSGLKDGFLVGGKLGLGFGEYLELRAVYMQTIGAETDFSDFGIPGFSKDLIPTRDVKVSRWGGELKANLSGGKFLPFVTVGTGVQSIERDTAATNKHIYVSLGAGITFSLADRYTLTVEAKNRPFNFNAGNNLLTADDRAALGVSEEDFRVNQLKSNWSLGASFQFYLGGRRPGELSALDKAYMNTFSGGLKGLRLPIEPTIARINFNQKLPYRDAYMAGGYIGLDFNNYIGIRAFYLQAMENDKISTDFDGLSMYGGELRLKLSASRGITPYIIIGGGRIDVKDDYVTADSSRAYSQAFASGGVGVTLPISSHFNLFGSARALMTSGTNITDIRRATEIQTSSMFTVGARFIIGKKAKPDVALATVVSSEVDLALEAQKKQNEVNRKNLRKKYEKELVKLQEDMSKAQEKEKVNKVESLQKKVSENEAVLAELKAREVKMEAEIQAAIAESEEQRKKLKKQYQERIVILEKELNTAYELRDLEKTPALLEEKKKAEENLDKIRSIEKQQQQGSEGKTQTSDSKAKPAAPSGRVQMTAPEFETLIETILKNMEATDRVMAPVAEDPGALTRELLLEIQKLNNKIDQNQQGIEKLRKEQVEAEKNKEEAQMKKAAEPAGKPEGNNNPEEEEIPGKEGGGGN